MYEKVRYDVSNYVMGAAFDGCGGVEYYAVTDGKTFGWPIRFVNFNYNGKPIDALYDKEVTVFGRVQTIAIDLRGAVLRIEQFLDERENAVYFSYTLDTEHKDDKVDIGLLSPLFSAPVCVDKQTFRREDAVFFTDGELEYIEDNEAVYFSLSASKPTVKAIFACGEKLPGPDEGMFGEFSRIYDRIGQEWNAIKVPAGLNEAETALFYSAYYCALENYKEKGDYKGFMAGCRYLSPMRTYYRDSYFTVLPMYNGHCEKVRNQIITLARGIHEDGSCPSALKSDWSDWWGDHYDSPSCFVMMLYDYICMTGDREIADYRVGDKTVFEKAVSAVEYLTGYTDETGLICKQGRYNKRDWADEVNRYGYVTYVEALYYRALYSIAEMYEKKGDADRARLYHARCERVRKAINDLLWDDEKGYYVNFRNEEYVEDNLSVDTYFAVLFDIADEKRAVRMLKQGERWLESAHNGTGIDFGCMCVYPFYRKIRAAKNKSSQPFNYHNGACWPYLTGIYACAKRKYGFAYKHLLTTPFLYALDKGNYTLLEYFSPYCEDGSLLQAWSGILAFILDEPLSDKLWKK